MKQHGVHAHVGMVMATDFSASLSREGMVVAMVYARISSCALLLRSRASRVRKICFSIREECRFLIGLGLRVCKGGLVTVFGMNIRRCSSTSSDNFLSEAGGVDAHIFDTSEARMTSARSALVFSPPGLDRHSAGPVGFVAVCRIVAKVNTSSRLGAVGASSTACHGGPLDNHLWEDVTNGAVFISDITGRVSSLFDITAVSMGMVMLMLVIVVVLVVAMTVFVVVIVVMSVVMSVASQDNKAQQVGEQAGAANNKNKLGVVDFGRLDKACQGFENDGHAKRD